MLARDQDGARLDDGSGLLDLYTGIFRAPAAGLYSVKFSGNAVIRWGLHTGKAQQAK